MLKWRSRRGRSDLSVQPIDAKLKFRTLSGELFDGGNQGGMGIGELV